MDAGFSMTNLPPNISPVDPSCRVADPTPAAEVPALRLENSRQTHVLWFLSGQTAEGEAVRHVPLHSFPFRIGRRTDAGLSLSYKTVSGLHAEIVERGGLLQLHDKGSTNGTFVNGQRVDGTVMLKQNDLVQFADVPFRVRRQSSDKAGLTIATRGCDYASLSSSSTS